MHDVTSLISVIVPCYNQGAFLSETLNSIISQTFPNWECIIVNDGSTDNTKLVAKNFCEQDKRFKYVEKENGGLSSARNTGLDVASGQYIQFLDSDDILLPTKFEIQIKILSNDRSIDLCISRYKLFSKDIENAYETKFSTADFDCSLDGFLYSWGEKFTFPPVCYFIKKEFLDTNRIQFNKDLDALEDWFFLVESTLKNATFYKTEQCLALYRKHNSNMSSDFLRMSKSLFKSAFLISELLPLDKRKEFNNIISTLIRDRLLKAYGERTIVKKANSIDYKVGYILLFPLHKISGIIKKIIRTIN